MMPASLVENFGKDWRDQLAFIVTMMRELSQQTDPLEMRRAYLQRMRAILPLDGSLTLSRRGLSYPFYRITRSSRWEEDINPWQNQDRLPTLEGGIIAEWIYGNEALLLENFTPPEADPAREYLEGYRSIAVIPLYDGGESINLALLMRSEPNAFSSAQFPEMVWTSNMYGRITHSLVLRKELDAAYADVDYELKGVASIQRRLLPAKLPKIPRLGIAAHYQTSRRAGGDYYDVFALPEGRWGLLIADVSGHGIPAAVVMAVTHALAHSFTGQQASPSELLRYLNTKLHDLHTSRTDTFVTAFYAIYDPATLRMTYASAGHNPPRLKRCEDGSTVSLDGVKNLPLGIDPDEIFEQTSYQLVLGDQVVLYTDGITEAHNNQGEMFGLARMDKVLENCAIGASDLLQAVLDALEQFAAGRPADDDRTILVLKVN
jgi:sigma-B regulation protein RsbU (phosphoserine phosphatase)